MPTFDDLAVRHFAALQAVAAERSFGRAAERLGFTQSAISQQIAAFEKAIGQPLFDRPGGPRQIELTPVGHVMLRHAEAILGHLDTAGDELAQLLAGQGGRLSVGTFQSITVKVLPEVIGRMKAERPGLEIRLTESNLNEELVELLIDGTVDLAFVVAPINDDRLVLTPLGSDPYVVIAPKDEGDHPIMERDDLAHRQLIGQIDDDACQRNINQYFWSSEIKPDYAFRTDDNAAVQAMVRVGMGLAVMPYLAIDPNDPSIAVRELSPPMPPRVHFAAQRADRTLAPAADRVIELARGVFERLEQSHTDMTRIAG
jgi:DNA-binding transcriptional LysR family regulator